MTAIDTSRFADLRTWLLSADFAVVPARPRLQGASRIEVANLNRALETHNWAAEPDLTELRLYSNSRARRILENPARLPIMVYRLVLRQMFDAADYGVVTPLTFAPEKIEILFKKQTRHARLRDEHGEYLARSKSAYAHLVTDLARRENLGSWYHRDELTASRRLLAIADDWRARLFQKHLAALLSAAEYTEVHQLIPEMQHALYPDIWTDGASRYARYLRATQPIFFEDPVVQNGYVQDLEGGPK